LWGKTYLPYPPLETPKIPGVHNWGSLEVSIPKFLNDKYPLELLELENSQNFPLSFFKD
jgi:hypothetical protein